LPVKPWCPNGSRPTAQGRGTPCTRRQEKIRVRANRRKAPSTIEVAPSFPRAGSESLGMGRMSDAQGDETSPRYRKIELDGYDLPIGGPLSADEEQEIGRTIQAGNAALARLVELLAPALEAALLGVGSIARLQRAWPPCRPLRLGGNGRDSLLRRPARLA